MLIHIMVSILRLVETIPSVLLSVSFSFLPLSSSLFRSHSNPGNCYYYTHFTDEEIVPKSLMENKTPEVDK